MQNDDDNTSWVSPRAAEAQPHPSQTFSSNLCPIIQLNAFFSSIQGAIALTLAAYLTINPQMQAVLPNLGGPTAFTQQFMTIWQQQIDHTVNIFEASPQDWARGDEIHQALRVAEKELQQTLLPPLKDTSLKFNANPSRAPFLLHYAGLFFVTQTVTLTFETLRQISPLTPFEAYTLAQRMLFDMNAELTGGSNPVRGSGNL